MATTLRSSSSKSANISRIPEPCTKAGAVEALWVSGLLHLCPGFMRPSSPPIRIIWRPPLVRPVNRIVAVRRLPPDSCQRAPGTSRPGMRILRDASQRQVNFRVSFCSFFSSLSSQRLVRRSLLFFLRSGSCLTSARPHHRTWRAQRPSL